MDGKSKELQLNWLSSLTVVKTGYLTVYTSTERSVSAVRVVQVDSPHSLIDQSLKINLQLRIHLNSCNRVSG